MEQKEPVVDLNDDQLKAITTDAITWYSAFGDTLDDDGRFVDGPKQGQDANQGDMTAWITQRAIDKGYASIALVYLGVNVALVEQSHRRQSDIVGYMSIDGAGVPVTGAEIASVLAGLFASDENEGD